MTLNYPAMTYSIEHVNFECDPAKAASNERKHGVPFEYCIRAFIDPKHVLIDTSRDQDRERRMKLVGSIEGLRFTVVFTMRGDIVRIISARRSNKAEEKAYADNAL